MLKQILFISSFLGYIFCLSSKERFSLFMQNPRPYLLSPQPKVPFRLIVLGPKGSGKTSLTYLLSETNKTQMINLNDLFQNELNKLLDKKLDLTCKETKKKFIEEIQQKNNLEIEKLKQG